MKGKKCCGFCDRRIIPPGVEPVTRGGLPICEDCETEFKNIFLTEINYLPKIPPSTNGTGVQNERSANPCNCPS